MADAHRFRTGSGDLIVVLVTSNSSLSYLVSTMKEMNTRLVLVTDAANKHLKRRAGEIWTWNETFGNLGDSAEQTVETSSNVTTPSSIYTAVTAPGTGAFASRGATPSHNISSVLPEAGAVASSPEKLDNFERERPVRRDDNSSPRGFSSITPFAPANWVLDPSLRLPTVPKLHPNQAPPVFGRTSFFPSEPTTGGQTAIAFAEQKSISKNSFKAWRDAVNVTDSATEEIISTAKEDNAANISSGALKTSAEGSGSSKPTASPSAPQSNIISPPRVTSWHVDVHDESGSTSRGEACFRARPHASSRATTSSGVQVVPVLAPDQQPKPAPAFNTQQLPYPIRATAAAAIPGAWPGAGQASTSGRNLSPGGLMPTAPAVKSLFATSAPASSTSTQGPSQVSTPQASQSAAQQISVSISESISSAKSLAQPTSNSQSNSDTSSIWKATSIKGESWFPRNPSGSPTAGYEAHIVEGVTPAGKCQERYQAITMLPDFRQTSFEELRLVDYALGKVADGTNMGVRLHYLGWGRREDDAR
jgi:hypothetical protein